MSKPNKQEILDCINNMKAVCAGGRKEIKGLVEKIIGEPLEEPLERFSSGDVFCADGHADMIILETYGINESTYFRAGFSGKFIFPFSNDSTLKSRNEMASELRRIGAKKVGTIKVDLIPLP